MRAGLIVAALAALLVACTPPAQNAETPTEEPMAEAPTNADPLAAAATPAIAADIGVPVSLAVTSSATDGDWGWLVAQPWTPEGAQLDWSQTRYAQRAAEGVLDGNGTTYVLLKRENGSWRVVEHVVGPTDVAWLEWPQRHGAPAALLGAGE